MGFCLRPITSGYGFVLRHSKLPSTLRKLAGVLDIIPCITVPPVWLYLQPLAKLEAQILVLISVLQLLEAHFSAGIRLLQLTSA
jgi:hypothetical protein